MKKYLFLLLLLPLAGIAQKKDYRVDKMLWQYEKPSAYQYRVDNFAQAQALGDSIVRESGQTPEKPDKEVILLAASLKPEEDMNIIAVSFKANGNITTYTLKGYVQRMMGYLKEVYGNMGTTVSLSTEELTVDGIPFIALHNKIRNESGRAYWTTTFIGEVSGKEFNFTTAYDKEAEGKVIEDSFRASAFRARR
ncbi:hypothetical protein EPD60_08370 [Flaviaesturariibacter flavus]|uniref:DUF4468 domain-containing protein n=1 Tax=Flaviaesturariibacter flavus TaxID=2502780 RepID=A0A4R1BAN7_9BACT|nr:hypothetical protein [Flaviaesturariibacter flavus]TCJ14019.1 hypothetical protein EPD60_08370 [Flaviaesturariibacter flavus]